MAHRSNFSEKKLSSSTYVGKTEISNPLLGKKSQLKNFPHTSPLKNIKNYQNFHHQQSATALEWWAAKWLTAVATAIGLPWSDKDSTQVNNSNNKNQGHHQQKLFCFIFLGRVFLMGTHKLTRTQPFQRAIVIQRWCLSRKKITRNSNRFFKNVFPFLAAKNERMTSGDNRLTWLSRMM